MFTLRFPSWVSFLALLGIGFHSAAVAQVSPAISVPVLRPLVQVSQAEQPVRLSKAEVRVQVSGGLAVTRVHLSLHNPNRRDLEGELQFPLRDGQTVTGFALESLDGQMLPAVAVAKARGQEVFEAIVRRGADPALLEQTQGNNYKLRVYPLPAGKARRVMLEISELLTVDAAGRYRYRIPEALAQAEALSLAIQVHGLAADKLSVPAVLRGAEVLNRHGDAWVLLERARPLDAGQTASESLQWPAPEQATVFSDRFEGASYFHADIPLPKGLSEPRPTRLLHRLALVWDASGSGAARDHDREFALLTALFNDLRDSGAMKVTLLVARDQAEAPREFEIRGGDWSALRAALHSLAYDGASNPAAWAPPAGHDLALLFSDGLGNWGGAAALPSTVPVYTLSASSSAHAERLRAIAEASPRAGRYLDLLRMDTASALAELLTLQPRLVTEEGDGVADVVFPSAYPQDGVLRLAGRLTRPRATLHYALHWPDGRVLKHALNIAAEPEATALISTLAARRWAGYRIAALEADPALHQAEIERLGKQFGLVTSRTSLLALENLADYLRYEVLPPPGPWREAYLQRQSGRQQKRHAQQSQHLDDLARRYAGLADWWSRDYPKNDPPKPVAPAQEQGRPGIEARTAGVGDAREGAPEARGERVAEAAGGAPVEEVRARVNPGVPLSVTLSAPSRQATTGVRVPDAVRPAHAAAPMTGASAPSRDQAAMTATAPAAIQLQPWQPDAPYARRLREAPDDQRYAVYLDERAGHLNSTAFFLDAADIFFEKGQHGLALRVLSNLAEMDLESRQILRVLAYRLLRAGEVKLALPLLRRVRDLAPEEPQSWRDLGLALAADGQHQAALEALWTVASRAWDGRFPDVDITALHELNALIAQHPGLDARAVDPRLLRSLPVGLRAVLTWDADNTDIDLWVLDPNGEKTYYSRQQSYQGGWLSRDFTGGYGPETFLLKDPKPGRYEIRAHFFGHRQQILLPYTTLMLRLTTGFGTPGQKDEDIVLRLTGRDDQVLVGSIEVGKPDASGR